MQAGGGEGREVGVGGSKSDHKAAVERQQWRGGREVLVRHHPQAGGGEKQPAKRGKSDEWPR